MVEAEMPDMRIGLRAYAIEVGTEPLARPTRNSVGGWPCFEEGQEWPTCFCGERMALFFQLDIPSDVEHFGGDHLLVFHCRDHNDALFGPLAEGDRLVDRYWDAPQGIFSGPFSRILLLRQATLPAAEREPSVFALPLTLHPFVDEPDEEGLGSQTFKVGGAPSWAQYPEFYQSACGADLVYVCQVPEYWEFDIYPGAPEQDCSVGNTYNLFLGNEVYLQACPDHCDPAAVWPVVQKF